MAEPRCCGTCGRWGNRAFRRDDQREFWVCSNDRACHRRASSRQATIAALAQQLMDGIKGRPLYDAWSGVGWWTPTVRLNERDAGIVATWALRVVSRPESQGGQSDA